MCPVVVRNSNDKATWEGRVAWHTFITDHPPNPLPARKGAEKRELGGHPPKPPGRRAAPLCAPRAHVPSLRGAPATKQSGVAVSAKRWSFSTHQAPCRCEECATKQSGVAGPAKRGPSAPTKLPVVARCASDAVIWGRGAGLALSSAPTKLPVVARSASATKQPGVEGPT